MMIWAVLFHFLPSFLLQYTTLGLTNPVYGFFSPPIIWITFTFGTGSSAYRLAEISSLFQLYFPKIL